MDPLSIASGVIAIIQLTSASTRAFKDLRNLCKTLPGRLHALSNEVNDLELVLHHVAELTRNRQSDLAFQAHATSLAHLPSHASAKLLEVHSIVSRLVSVCQQVRPNILNARAWKKNQPRIQSLQEEIRSIKTNLNILLGTLHSQDVSCIQVQLNELCSSTASLASFATAKVQENLESDISKALERMSQNIDERIANVEEVLHESAIKFEERQAQQIGTLYGPRGQSQALIASARPQPVSPSLIQAQDVGIRVSTAVVPEFANRLLGQLFISYAGLPVFRNNWRLASCKTTQSSQLSLEYWFPGSFFWSQIIRFRMGYSATAGPQFDLMSLRIIPDSSPAVHLAMKGDIEGLKDMFKRGLASPRDLSTTRGYSLLRWAVYGQKFKAARFLLHAGGDPDYRPIAVYDNTPRHNANRYLLMGGLADEDADALRSLTQEGDFIDEQNYTSIHRIILGLLYMDLDQELRNHPELIDVPDAMGRTPLIWAACRGDQRAVSTLLENGAEVNVMDIQYTNAVSYAAERDFAICVRLLLEAGADPNIAQAYNLPVGDAINVAARNASDPLVIKTLLDFGASPDYCGRDNTTALIHAARRDNASFALLLLENSADINATTSAGLTPLTVAVTNNSHNVLKLLLDRWFEYSECPRLKGPHFLELAAKYADIETLIILTGTDHFLTKYDKAYLTNDFKTALKERPDTHEKLSHAFEELIGVVATEMQAAPVSSHGANSHQPRDLEAGLSPASEKEAQDLIQQAVEGSDDDSDQAFEDALEGLHLTVSKEEKVREMVGMYRDGR